MLQFWVVGIDMPYQLLHILPAMMDETYRIAIIQWVIPWVKDLVKSWMEIWMEIAILLNRW